MQQHEINQSLPPWSKFSEPPFKVGDLVRTPYLNQNTIVIAVSSTSESCFVLCPDGEKYWQNWGICELVARPEAKA